MTQLDAGVARLVENCLRSGKNDSAVQVFYLRPDDRGALLRVALDAGKSVVAKVWKCDSLRDRVRRAVGVSNGRREWRMHCFLRDAGLPLPRPIRWMLISVRGRCDHELMLTEDLGETVRALEHLKQLIVANADDEVTAFEEEVIRLTRSLVNRRVIDVDHQLNNIVVDRRGRALRIDVECARRYWLRTPPVSAYGVMLARLICSHVYASQPEIARSEAFAIRLADALDAPASVLLFAERRISELLDAQRELYGVDSRLELRW